MKFTQHKCDREGYVPAPGQAFMYRYTGESEKDWVGPLLCVSINNITEVIEDDGVYVLTHIGNVALCIKEVNISSFEFKRVALTIEVE